MARRVNIENGPSKFDLMLGLFDRQPERKVTFRGYEYDGRTSLTAEMDFIARIDVIGAEDGTGEGWNIEFTENVGSRYQRNFKGYYNSRSRKGDVEEF